MTSLISAEGIAKGVNVTFSEAIESGRHIPTEKFQTGKNTIMGDAVVIATGHSARDVYEELHRAGVQLEAKGFAAGFRVEHPQRLINEIQYGSEWGASVHTGKKVTDEANQEHFLAGVQHSGKLPVPSYRLATDKAFDGSANRGAYSFCMCPGGQIVPASTEPNEVCVNGMSFSKRDSLWANSALVVTVSADDEVLEPYRAEYGVLAGIAFQRDMERRASIMGGGNLTVPVQRLTDFVNGVPNGKILKQFGFHDEDGNPSSENFRFNFSDKNESPKSTKKSKIIIKKSNKKDLIIEDGEVISGAEDYTTEEIEKIKKENIPPRGKVTKMWIL